MSEVYSPPRVTAEARRRPQYGLLPGFALDLTTCDELGQAWDFAKPERRAAARDLLRRTKPLFVVGSPMCTAWCSWQALNAAKHNWEAGKLERLKAEARVHLEFVVSLG